MSKPTYEELLQASVEYREACCAAMRVLAGEDVARHLLGIDDAAERFTLEVRAAGVMDGFGKRNDEIIRRAKGDEMTHDTPTPETELAQLRAEVAQLRDDLELLRRQVGNHFDQHHAKPVNRR